MSQFLKKLTLFELLLCVLAVLQLLHFGVLYSGQKVPLALLYGPLYWAAYQYEQGVSRRRIARNFIYCVSPFLIFAFCAIQSERWSTSIYYTYYLPLALLEQLIYPVLILFGLYRTKQQTMRADLLKQLMACGLGSIFIVSSCLFGQYWAVWRSFELDSIYTISITMCLTLFLMGNYLYHYCRDFLKRDAVYQADARSTISDAMQKIGRQLRKAMEQDQLYRDAKLTLQDLADVVGLSKKEISAYLHEVNGLSYYEWLSEYRIAYALQLLERDNDYTIEAIAQQCGYSSKTTFVRYFKEQVGVLPSAYRSQLLNS